ncbi:hypothetical protein [Streptomyces capitiformicae]|uniref:Uncharacterized protein n=1 Tax=Streptomyces capitiformicae TaxID=2014920 RepID=A0A919L5Y0_9ACTN|nr:hypothetical protein [Streptomyces capitiformicae]GHH83876.1 hypothetical protein GCM10017771_11600 [Streptomyces capitiformicae]
MAKYPELFAGMKVTADLLSAGQPDIVTKQITESVTSSTTFQNDDELFVSVEANAKYRVQLFLLHSSPTAGDIKLQFTAPAGASFNWGVHGAETAVTTSNAVPETVMASRNIGEIANFGGGASTGTTAFIEGTLTTAGTAGTLQLQWAQRVSDASATQVRAGTILSVKRIA